MWITLLDNWKLILSNWSWSEAVTSKLQKSKIQKKKIDLRKIETKQVTIGQPAVLVIWIENFDSKWNRIKPGTTIVRFFLYTDGTQTKWKAFTEIPDHQGRTVGVYRTSTFIPAGALARFAAVNCFRPKSPRGSYDILTCHYSELTIGHKNCMNFELKINQLVVVLHEFAGTNIWKFTK